MCKRILFAAVVVALYLGLSAAYGLGAENEKVGVLRKMKNAYNDFRGRQQQKSQAINREVSKQPPAPKAQPKHKEMTKEEMLAKLKKDIADNDEVFDAVPELKASADQNGNAVYTYKNITLDELSKEDLADLYIRVRQFLVKARTDRIQGQLERIRQVERIQAPANPPQPPRIPAQAQPQRIPAAPSSAPKVPSLPPSAPQRR